MNSTETKNKKKTALLGVIAFAALLVVLLLVYRFAAPKTTEGAKEVSITVTDAEGTASSYSIHTDAEYLRQAMDDAAEDGLSYSGSGEGTLFMVDTVNGVTADYNTDGAYWSFYVNGEYCNYGIEEQPVADGDAFEITYTLAE